MRQGRGHPIRRQALRSVLLRLDSAHRLTPQFNPLGPCQESIEDRVGDETGCAHIESTVSGPDGGEREGARDIRLADPASTSMPPDGRRRMSAP